MNAHFKKMPKKHQKVGQKFLLSDGIFAVIPFKIHLLNQKRYKETYKMIELKENDIIEVNKEYI